MYVRRAFVLLCPLRPHLVGGLGDHLCLKVMEKPFMSGYFLAREASAVSKGTGIIYKAGVVTVPSLTRY